MKIIYGIIGTIGSGKDVVAEYIAGLKHIEVVQTSQPLKDICKERGIEPTRDNLIALGTEQSNTLGDVRVISRFSATDDNSFGLIFGVKLPTGPINATFADGITPLDRSLQPGTGSGDVIIGAYTSGQLDKYDWFVQGLFQSAITTQSSPSTDLEYSPGDTKSLNMGIRYTSLSKTIEPMLQINMISRNSDTGSAATPLITGADLIYLTPGVSVKFGNSTTAFAFLQLPIYQNVNASDPNGVLGTGSQLTPIRILSIGVTHSI